ncbi:hypothetical protein Btru_008259 [Bulinus truncatus]|nr:hypothetical protein Btru_008259 [Bulinus truncatus]
MINQNVYKILFSPKSKRRQRDEPGKVYPGHHGVSPNVSQNSTLNHDVQFPKVSGNGLWLGAPGMHAVTPSPAYYMHTSNPQPMLDMPPSYLQRVTPERWSQSMPVPGPQRIYHSQQMGSLHELPPTMLTGYSPMGMEIYDYPALGGAANGVAPRSKLLETKRTPYMYGNDNFMFGKKIERSHSDVHKISKPPVPHKFHHMKQNSSSSSQERNSQTSFKESFTYIKDDKQKLVVSEGLSGLNRNKATQDDVHGSYHNRAFSTDSGLGKSSTSIDKPNAPHLIAMKSPKRASQSNGTPGLVSTYVSKPDKTAPSTESLKILANNKTDDQKTHPSFTDVLDSIQLPEMEAELDHREYRYSGLIVSSKSDKSYAVTKSSTSSTDSGAYSEILAVNKTKKTVLNDNKMDEHVVNEIVDTLVLPEITDVERSKPVKDNVPFGNSQVRSSLHSHALFSTESRHIINLDEKKPKEIQTATKISHHELAADDVNNAGKITDTAFEFLDNYLSEDEGTDNTLDNPVLS